MRSKIFSTVFCVQSEAMWSLHFLRGAAPVFCVQSVRSVLFRVCFVGSQQYCSKYGLTIAFCVFLDCDRRLVKQQIVFRKTPRTFGIPKEQDESAEQALEETAL